jgi:hypothetical protein
MANDDAVGDFCGVLAGLHYVGDLFGAQLRDHLRRQFILEWQRRVERGDELTSFLANADWLAHRNSVPFKPKT